MTELGRHLQEQYDSGAGGVTLRKVDGAVTWTQPVFLDRPGFGDKFVVDLGGNDVIVSVDMPTVGRAFTPDPGVRVALFANTKREAYNEAKNSVAVESATKATQVGGSPRLIMRNGRVLLTGNSGLAFGNRCGAVLENVVLHGGRFAWSWTDYADQHVIRNGHMQTAGGSAQVTDAFYLYGIAKGDGVHVDGMKCDGAVGGVALKECFGATLTSIVTSKVRLDRCAGVVVNGAHQESGIHKPTNPFTANFEIKNSSVSFVGGAFYPPRYPGRATIEVRDNPEHTPSNVVLMSPDYRLLDGHAVNAEPFIVADSSTPVRVIYPSWNRSTANGRWAPTDQPEMRGNVRVIL